MALVVDLTGGDDFVEDGTEGLILPDHPGRHQRRHDELPLSDVGLHGNPEAGRERCRATNTTKATPNNIINWDKEIYRDNFRIFIQDRVIIYTRGSPLSLANDLI